VLFRISTLSATGPSHDITASYRDGILEVRVAEPQGERSASVIPVERV
jgi:HSP20 family molecular chaperone IbpA